MINIKNREEILKRIKEKESNRDKVDYIYIKDEEHYKTVYPYAKSDKPIKTVPESYPCVMRKTSHKRCVGIYFTLEFIYEMSDFIYQNGRLYKGC